MSEVVAQMKPFSDLLKAVHDWQVGFWSNGSGKPPGFFQMRMLEDDERNEMLVDFVKTAQRRQLESEMAQKQKEKQWAFWLPIAKWTLRGLGAGLIGIGCYVGPKVVKVGTILIQDYMLDHPSVTEQLKHVGNDADKGYSDPKKSTVVSDGR